MQSSTRRTSESASVRSAGTSRSNRSNRSSRSRASGGGGSDRNIDTLALNSKGLPQTAEAREQTKFWLHGPCSCGGSCSGCMYSLFCPPCAVATAVTRFDGSSWANNCCFVNPCMARNVVREGYGIEGHCCSDLLCTCLFLPCMTGQLLAETAERGSVIDHWARSNRYRSPTLTQWKFGLCGFTEDPGKLFYALCMPWCALGSVRTDLDGSDWIFNCCFLNSCAARAMVRHAYNIEGTTANDVATSCFCLPCAISQMMIEVQHRGRVNGPERLVVGPPGVQLQSMVR